MRSEIVLIVAVLGLLPCAGRAQGTGTVACPSIDNDQERLACYDRAMRAAPRAPSSPATPPASVQAPATATPAAVAAPVALGAAAAASPPPPVTAAPPAPATFTPAASPPAAAAPTNGTAVAAAAATTAVAATAASGTSATGAASTAAASPPSTVSTAPHNARTKHVGSPGAPGAPPTIDPATGQPTGVMPIVVLSTLVRPGFPIEFTTDKAGVWVQGETKPLPALPKAPFNAQLEPGKLGGAFLVVPDKKLGVRVYGADR